jgi:Cu/Zn superoxide dismutase
MSWGYFSGDVIDYKTTGPDIFADANASAIMIGMDDKSFFRLRVTGIKAEDDTSPTYGVHLHQGPCDADFPGDLPKGAGPHYNANWNPLGTLRDNEVWLDLNVNSDGNARSTATVSFIPEDGTRSIVLHADPTVSKAEANGPAVGSAGARLACLPFNIKVYGN